MYDDGNGPAVYAGGNFWSVDGVLARGIARWMGDRWESIGDLDDFGKVNAMAVHDDGSGPRLWIAGDFSRVGGKLANNVAAWDGQTWSSVGGLSGGATSGRGRALHSDGTTLYVGGRIEAGAEIEPGEIRGKSLRGAKASKLQAGDTVNIPPNTPHQVVLGDGEKITYLIVKVRAE